jgi:hypothetical protein|tara:strand:- start:1018 stop:1338 length:321 start_codon:yes stop_codon:yes gene_type:complete
MGENEKKVKDSEFSQMFSGASNESLIAEAASAEMAVENALAGRDKERLPSIETHRQMLNETIETFHAVSVAKSELAQSEGETKTSPDSNEDEVPFDERVIAFLRRG